jgi:hypothetical protein
MSDQSQNYLEQSLDEGEMSETMQVRVARASRAERMTTSCGECRRRKQKVQSPHISAQCLCIAAEIIAGMIFSSKEVPALLRMRQLAHPV